MKPPNDAYREGFEKGRADNLAGNISEAIFGIMKDDPGGHYAAGYRDGAAGNRFNPPGAKAQRPHADAELNPFDEKVAVRTECPNCEDTDWFEWKFLGKLTDPVCGHSWYAGSGMYTLRQLSGVFEMVVRRQLEFPADDN